MVSRTKISLATGTGIFKAATQDQVLEVTVSKTINTP